MEPGVEALDRCFGIGLATLGSQVPPVCPECSECCLWHTHADRQLHSGLLSYVLRLGSTIRIVDSSFLLERDNAVTFIDSIEAQVCDPW